MRFPFGRRLVLGWIIAGSAGLVGCKEDAKTATGDDLIALVDSDAPAVRLEGCKQLAAQGESAIPRIAEAFAKAEGKPDVQTSLAEAVFRMAPSAATVAALEKMAEQARDPIVREQIDGFARQRKQR